MTHIITPEHDRRPEHTVDLFTDIGRVLGPVINDGAGNAIESFREGQEAARFAGVSDEELHRRSVALLREAGFLTSWVNQPEEPKGAEL